MPGVPPVAQAEWTHDDVAEEGRLRSWPDVRHGSVRVASSVPVTSPSAEHDRLGSGVSCASRPSAVGEGKTVQDLRSQVFLSVGPVPRSFPAWGEFFSRARDADVDTVEGFRRSR